MKKQGIFKNRWLLGSLSVVVGILLLLVVQPYVVGRINEQITVIRVKEKEIKAGDKITKENIEKVTIGKYHLPAGILTKEEEIIGQYAASKLYQGDMFTGEKLTAAPVGEEYLLELPAGKMAVSVTLSSFAGGLSGKLEKNDIVRIVAVNEDAYVPESLQYVLALAVTNGEGTDKEKVDSKKEAKDRIPKTITLLVSDEQARELAYLEEKEKIHIALVFRGEKPLREEFLEKQEEILTKLSEKGPEKEEKTNDD